MADVLPLSSKQLRLMSVEVHRWSTCQLLDVLVFVAAFDDPVMEAWTFQVDAWCGRLELLGQWQKCPYLNKTLECVYCVR